MMQMTKVAVNQNRSLMTVIICESVVSVGVDEMRRVKEEKKEEKESQRRLRKCETTNETEIYFGLKLFVRFR
jgi:hypothetical protein